VIDWGAVARIVHVLAVVVWIGGVWMVTTILLPAIAAKAPAEFAQGFREIEQRFAPQARIAVILVLLSGLYMAQRYALWPRFGQSRFWWMHLMVFVWALFALLLFVLEPLVLRRKFHQQTAFASRPGPAAMLRLHRVMLGLALAAIAAAVGGREGLF